MGNLRDIYKIQAWVDGEASPELSRELESWTEARREAESLSRFRAAIVAAEIQESHPVPFSSDFEALKQRVIQSESEARELGLRAQALADCAQDIAADEMEPEALARAERIRDLSRLLRENAPSHEAPVAPGFFMDGIRGAIETRDSRPSGFKAPLSGLLKWVRAPQFASAAASFVALLLVASQLQRSEPSESTEEMEVIYVAVASDPGMQAVFWVNDRPAGGEALH